MTNVSQLEKLKVASTLDDVARLLGYKANALSYILYKLPDAGKYTTFSVPKKCGGTREINAPTPRVKALQKRLATLLSDCVTELEQNGSRRRALSHGFKPRHSIITNAKNHRNKRYVFNVDLEDFFPSFNFGRVRGFFIKNQDFALQEKVATVIAQIACFNNQLPQGSPCSPIITNLIGHILDVELAGLAKRYRCDYSRYADDLTFSTNQKVFPEEVARALDADSGTWLPGDKLLRAIKRNRFSVNDKKTRMQLRGSRQVATGLVVNAKVNVRSEYYRYARSMCNSLFMKGSYHVPWRSDESDNEKTLSDLRVIEGILGHIYHVRDYSDVRTLAEKKDDPTALRRLRRKLLFYKYFINPVSPLVICEGKTDSIYLKCALQQLPAYHPKLREEVDGKVQDRIRFLRYSRSVSDILQLGGGTGDLTTLIKDYDRSLKLYKHCPLSHPIIVLIDNDDGAVPLFKMAKGKYKVNPTLESKEAFYHLHENLYLIKTPELGVVGTSCIEDLFDSSVLSTVIEGKTFNLKKDHGSDTEYGKLVFAEKVVKPNRGKIDFSQFAAVFDRIIAVLEDYEAKSKKP
jgi:RNA-directed DNA polymerase